MDDWQGGWMTDGLYCYLQMGMEYIQQCELRSIYV